MGAELSCLPTAVQWCRLSNHGRGGGDIDDILGGRNLDDPVLLAYSSSAFNIGSMGSSEPFIFEKGSLEPINYV